jgi:hypothetical protein
MMISIGSLVLIQTLVADAGRAGIGAADDLAGFALQITWNGGPLKG